MKKLTLIVIVSTIMILTSCSENYSNGERIGTIQRFTERGILWKSWEGTLTLTQTGMNQSGKDFDFSFDNDRKGEETYTKNIKLLDSAANNGWLVKVIYHEVSGYNWFGNRGDTDHFVKEVTIVNRNIGMRNLQTIDNSRLQGHIIDTIYLVIDKTK